MQKNNICENCKHYQHIELPTTKIEPFGVCMFAEEITHPASTCTEWLKGKHVTENPSFYDTVVHSPEWQAWEKEVSNRMSIGNYKKAFDVAESVELGFLSPLHFDCFLDFCCEKRYEKELGICDDRFKVCEKQLADGFEPYIDELAKLEEFESVIKELKKLAIAAEKGIWNPASSSKRSMLLLIGKIKKL